MNQAISPVSRRPYGLAAVWGSGAPPAPVSTAIRRRLRCGIGRSFKFDAHQGRRDPLAAYIRAAIVYGSIQRCGAR
jgi:hypothetical protein